MKEILKELIKMENNEEEKLKKFDIKTHAKIVYLLYIFQVVLVVLIGFKIGFWILFECFLPMLILGVLVVGSVRYKKKSLLIFMEIILLAIIFMSIAFYIPIYWSV